MARSLAKRHPTSKEAQYTAEFESAELSHGFAFPQRPAYHKPSAERHWERLFELFGEALT